jgi:hypothetical protein
MSPPVVPTIPSLREVYREQPHFLLVSQNTGRKVLPRNGLVGRRGVGIRGGVGGGIGIGIGIRTGLGLRLGISRLLGNAFGRRGTVSFSGSFGTAFGWGGNFLRRDLWDHA